MRALRRGVRLLLAAVATLGLVAHLVAVWDAAHPVDRARALPLGRALQAGQDLAARRGALPHLDALAAAPPLAYVVRPSLVEVHRLDDIGAPGWRPSADSSPDLSRSPPGR